MLGCIFGGPGFGFGVFGFRVSGFGFWVAVQVFGLFDPSTCLVTMLTFQECCFVD